ncbi:hypothetical protein EDB89DRAFT_1968974, partial [Lactarius sanguifluus]
PIILGKYVVPTTALYLWAISSALVDILIAVAMTLLLRRASGNFSSFVLIRVVQLTIETNTLTAALAITSLVLYVAFPNELYYVYTVEIWESYSNTLLVSLNNRIYLRDHRSPGHGDSARPPGPVPVLDKARAVTETSLRFATPEPQPRTLKNDIDIFSRSIISQPVDLDNSRGDEISTGWPLSRPTLGNVIYFPKISSGQRARRSILTTEKTRCMDCDGYWCGRCNVDWIWT